MLNEEGKLQLNRAREDLRAPIGALYNACKTGVIDRGAAMTIVQTLERLNQYVDEELARERAAIAANESSEIEPPTPTEEEPCSAENTPSPFGVQVPNMPGSKNFSKPSAPKGGKTKT